MDVPLAPLGALPVERLQAVLPDAGDAIWDQFAMRRTMPMHAATRTIAVVWGDMLPGIAEPVIFEPEGLPVLLRAAAIECANVLVERLGGGTISRLMLVDLPAGAKVLPHRDIAPIITEPRRCHVPVETNDRVSFVIDGVDHHLAAGQAYEVDNTRQHSVANRGDTRRVHLICDVMPQRGG